MANLLGYITNVGKSITYSTLDYVKENMDTVKDFKETNGDLFKSMYSDITNYKQTYQRFSDITKKSKIYEAGEILKRSLIEDAKNGTFYNNKRFEEVSTSSMGFDASDEFGDLGDFNFDDETDFNFNDKPKSKSNNLLQANMNETSRANANAVSMSMARSAEYTAHVAKENTNLLYVQNANAFEGFNKHMNVINNNIGSLTPIVDIVKIQAENQKKYAEESTKLLQDQTALLREISDNVKKLSEPQQQQIKKQKLSYKDVVGYSGMPDLKNYGTMVKENIMNNNELGFLTSTLNSMGDDTNMLAALASNPYSFILDTMVKGMIPKATKKSMKKLDNTASSLFGNFMAKINTVTSEDYDDNPVSGTLKKMLRMLSIDNSGFTKKSLNTDRFNRGPMKWNGDAHRALTEVIPQILSKIESNTSGEPEKVFDYKTGKFVKASNLKQEFESYKSQYRNNAVGDVETQLNKNANKIKMSLDERDKLREDIKSVLDTIYEKGEMFNYNKKNVNYMDYNVSNEDNMSIIQGLFKHLENSQKETLTALSKNIFSQRSSQKDDFTNMEEEGSIYSLLFNNSDFDKNFKFNKDGTIKSNSFSKTSALNIKSSKGYDGFWYLDEIVTELKAIRNSISDSLFGNSKKNKRRKYNESSEDTKFDLEKFRPDKKMDLTKAENRIARDRERTEEQFEKEQTKLDKEGNLIDLDKYDYDDYSKVVSNSLNFTENIKKADKKISQSNRKSMFRELVDDIADSEENIDKVDKVFKSLNNAINRPMEFVTRTMDKVDRKLFDVFYGSDDTGNGDIKNPKGLIDLMLLNMQNKFGQFSLWMEDKIIDPLSEKLDFMDFNKMQNNLLEKTGLMDIGTRIKTYLFGDKDTGITGIFSDITSAIKDKFTSAKDSVKGAFGNVFNPIKNKFINHSFDHLDKDPSEAKAAQDFSNGLANNISDYMMNNIQFHATGGKIDKSHVAVVGEGERVLPKEANDIFENFIKYMSDSIDKMKSGKLKDSKFANNVSKRFNKVLSSKEEGSEEYNQSYLNLGDAITNNSLLDKLDNNKDKERYFNIIKSVVDNKGKENKTEAQDFVGQMMSELKTGANKVMESLGGGDTRSIKDKEKIGPVIDDITKNVGIYAPDAVASGLLGGGLSLITGMVGGPLVGAALGAGLSITKNSDKMQNFLFGTEDKEGLVPKKFINKLKKYTGDLKNFGIVGGISGLMPFMPFGPITGIMLGAATAYAKNNENVQKKLFGEEGLFKPESKAKLKKALPRMGAGALLGAAFGPFGILGGSAIGAGMGYLTTSDKFNEWLFGKKGPDGKYIGGMLPKIKEKVFDPLIDSANNIKDKFMGWAKKSIMAPVERAFKPLKKQVELWGKGLLTGTLKIVDRILENSLGVPTRKLFAQLSKPFTFVGKKILKGASKVTGGAISLPFQAIGKLGDHYKKKQIKSGNADYLSAKERVDFRKTHLMGFNDDMGKMDEILANSNSIDLETMKNSFKNIKDDHKANKSARIQSIDDIGSTISKDLGFFTSKSIMKHVNKGDYETARRQIQSSSQLSDDQRNILLNQFDNKINKFKDTNKNFLEGNENYNKLSEAMNKKGIKIPKEVMKDPAKLQRYIDLIDKELKNKSPEDETNEILEEANKENLTFHDDMRKRLDDIRVLMSDHNPAEIKKKKFTKNTIQRDENGLEFHLDDQNNKIFNKGDSFTKNTLLKKDKEDKEEEENQEKEESFREGITDYFGIDKDKDKRKNGFLTALLGKSKKVAKYGLIGAALLFAPEIIKIAKNTVLPIVSKVGNTIFNKAVPAIGRCLGTAIKTAIVSTGKFVVNYSVKALKKMFNSTVALIPGIKKLNTSEDVFQDADKELKESGENWIGTSNQSNEYDPLHENDIKTSSTGLYNPNQEYDEDGISYNLAASPTEKDPEYDKNHEGMGNVQSGLVRYVATGGRTGNILKAGKTAENLGKKSGKAMNWAYKATHPIRGILRGKSSFMGRTVSKIGSTVNSGSKIFNKMAKGVNKATTGINDRLASTKLGTLAGKAGQSITEKGANIIDNCTKNIKDFLVKILTNSKISSLIGEDKAAKLLEKFVPTFLEKVTAKLASNVAKVSARMVSLVSTGGLLNIVWAIKDFIEGYRNAQSILGITEEPSFGLKISCGLTKALLGLFIILSFVPDSYWADIICDIIMPIFSKEENELQKMRASARKELDDYNEKNGTDLEMEEFIKNNKKPSGTMFGNFKTKVKDTASNIWEGTKNFASSAWEGTKNFFTGNGGPSENNIYAGMGGGAIKGIPMGTEKLASVYTDYDNVFKQAGQQYGLDPEYIKAISMQESGGNKNNYNGAALGLMQIENGGTTDEFIQYGKEKMGESWSPADRSDPNKAVPFGTYRLAEDLKRYNNDYLKATQAYNFSHYSLDALLKAFPNGDEWMDQRQYIGKYNGTGAGPGQYGDPKYIEHVLRYYHGDAISSDGTGTGAISSSNNSETQQPEQESGIAGLFSGISQAFGNGVKRNLGLSVDPIGTSSSSTGNANYSGDAPSSEDGNKIVNIAKSFLGDPYVWGGNGEPLSEATVNRYKGSDHDISKNADWRNWLGKPGYDCSGFAQAVYKQMGIDISRTTTTQVNDGVAVDKANLATGDLVLFGNASSPHHVGIYSGNGNFIEAPKSGDVIKETPLSNRSDFSVARRIIGSPIDKRARGGAEYTGMGGGFADNFFSKTLNGNITSGFGHRDTKGNIPSNHTGIDVGAKEGSSIKAPIGGTVVKKANPSESNGFGNLLVVKDKNNAEHYFGHMQNQSNLKPGDKIKSGDKIGNVGNTGNSTGSHLHYETRVGGRPIEPNKYLSQVKKPEKKTNNGIGGAVIDKPEKKESNNKLLQNVITILAKICTNTESLTQIVQLLTSGNTTNTNQQTTKNDNNTSKSQIILQKMQEASKNNQSISTDTIMSFMEQLALE